MKNLLPLILIFFACNKAQQPQQFTGGLLPDNPKEVAKVKLMQSHKLNVVLRGKPVKGDRTNPVVTIYSPVAGEVTGIVNVTGQVSDKSGITSIQLYVNGVLHSTVYNVAYFGFSWDTRLLPDDAYQLQVIAYDPSGNAGSASVTVTKNTIVLPPPDVDPSTAYIIPMPPVMNQGSEGSCVGFAVGYAARSVDWKKKTGTGEVFSPEFLYNQIKFSSDCSSGTSMQMALDFVKANGIATWAAMPYTSGDCSLFPTTEQAFAALNYKIGSYVKLYTTDEAAIKALIKNNQPVIVSVIIDNSFLAAKTDFIWQSVTGGAIGHCVVLCGYDDTKHAYRIFNSFGTAWGGGGYCWIDYDFFLTRTGTYCYAIL